MLVVEPVNRFVYVVGGVLVEIVVRGVVVVVVGFEVVVVVVAEVVVVLITTRVYLNIETQGMKITISEFVSVRVVRFNSHT
mgnify:FL=1